MIRTHPEEFELSASKNVWGPIYLSFDGKCFPERDWSDLPMALIGMWLVGAYRIQKFQERVDFPFMDGPYSFEIEPISKSDGKLHFLANEKPDAVFEIKLQEFFISLRRVSSEIVEYCEQENRDWPEVTRIRELLDNPDVLEKALEKQLELEQRQRNS